MSARMCVHKDDALRERDGGEGERKLDENGQREGMSESEREREKRRGTKPESTKLETHYGFAPPMLFDETPTNRILAYRNRACTVNLGIASKYTRALLLQSDGSMCYYAVGPV